MQHAVYESADEARAATDAFYRDRGFEYTDEQVRLRDLLERLAADEAGAHLRAYLERWNELQTLIEKR